MKRIRDPIHGFVIVEDDELRILDDPLVQRLRRVKQLGFDHYVYPGAVHDRFSHSLGTMHVASRIVDSLRSKGFELPRKPIRLAALTHDIGHTPMSHTLELFLLRAYGTKHEDYTEAILEGRGREFLDVLRDPGLSRRVISGELDADRMDYLYRDSYYCGVKYGQFDLDRLVQGLTVVDGELGVLYKARYALQSFVLARFQMYQQVYMHKTSAGFSVAAARLMMELNEEYPYPTVDEVRDDPDKLAEYDDYRFMRLVKQASKRGGLVGTIARQLLNRRRFKRLYEKEVTLTHRFSERPRRYHAIIKNLEEIEASGGLVHAPEFVPLAPPYKDGTSSLLVVLDDSVADIRELDPVLDALSSHYTLIIRVYAAEGYEEAVRRVLKSLDLQTPRYPSDMLTVKVLVDNNEALDPESKCAPAPGLSLLLERDDFSILFDTGPDRTIVANADRLGVDRSKIDSLVISHRHRDHTGGIPYVFEERPDLRVFLPEDLDVPFAEKEVVKDHVMLKNLRDGSIRIVRNMGEYKGYGIPENSLVLVDRDGDAYIFCGCCHPGVVNVLERVKALGYRPLFVGGGLHLIGKTREELEEIAEKLVKLGVEIAMPIHCSGYAIREVLSDMGVIVIEAGVCSQVPFEYRGIL